MKKRIHGDPMAPLVVQPGEAPADLVSVERRIVDEPPQLLYVSSEQALPAVTPPEAPARLDYWERRDRMLAELLGESEWEGRQRYACRGCGFASASRGWTVRHILERHVPGLSSSAVLDASGNPLTVEVPAPEPVEPPAAPVEGEGEPHVE